MTDKKSLNVSLPLEALRAALVEIRAMRQRYVGGQVSRKAAAQDIEPGNLDIAEWELAAINRWNERHPALVVLWSRFEDEGFLLDDEVSA